METPARIAAFAGAVALAGAAAWGAGALTAPPPPAVAAPAPAPAVVPAGPGADGLAATAAGYRLAVDSPVLPVSTAAVLAITLTGPDGRPVTAYTPRDGQDLRLMIVRRDAAAFQLLDPVLGPDGVWRAPLTLPYPGFWRVLVDATPTGGPPLVLGTDLAVPGLFAPLAFPPSRTDLVDGYQVRLDGDLVPGRASQVFATVSRDGAPVTDLQPELAAFGHLVALRAGDLACTVARPGDGRAPAPAPDDRGGPGIAFTAAVPTPGTYRLFLQFRHGDAVHTAAFTIPTRTAA